MNRILVGDSAEVLKTLPADSVDLTVTSPPYDNLRTYNGYSFDFEAIAAELFRVTKPGGVVVWVVGDATVKGSESGTSFRQALHFKDVCGFSLHDTMIYTTDKPPCTAPRYQPQFEYMFVLAKGKPKAINLLREPCRKFGVNDHKLRGYRTSAGEIDAAHGKDGYKRDKPRGNVWYFASGHNCSTLDKVAFSHPAIFPEQLASDHISSWSNPGDTVLDPFMGSGTTGKMAALAGRKFIGIEISPEYAELARERMSMPQATHHSKTRPRTRKAESTQMPLLDLMMGAL